MSAEFDNFTRSWHRQRDQLEFNGGLRAAVAVVLLLLVAGVLIAVAVAGPMLVACAVAGSCCSLAADLARAVGAPPRYNRFIKFKETRTQ